MNSIEKLCKYVAESSSAQDVSGDDLSVLLNTLRSWSKTDIFPCELSLKSICF